MPSSASTAEPDGRPRPFAAVVAGAVVLLAARRPEAWLAPQLYAEDGAVFFRDAFEASLAGSLLRPHAGYPELVPRLLAELATALPLESVPLAYALVSLALAATALAWIALPAFRGLVPSDGARLALVALLCLAPNQEALMKLAYLQWYLLAWAALASVMPLPRARAARAALALALGLVFASAPVSWLLLPLWALRLGRGAGATGAAVLLAGAAAVLATAGLAWGETLAVTAPGLGFAERLRGWLLGLVTKALAASVAGERGALALWRTLGWPGVLAAAALPAALLASAFARRPTRGLAAVSLYLVLGSSAGFLLRAPLVAGFAAGEGLAQSGRYFFLASATVLVALAALANARSGSGPRTLAAVLALAAVQLPGFALASATPVDYDWRAQCERIERAQARADATGRAQRLVVPLNPGRWQIELTVAPHG